MGRYIMTTNKETCLGVLSLETASWIIASVQLLYNFFYIIGDIVRFQTSIAQEDKTTTLLTSIILVWTVVADCTAIYGAIVLGVGNTLSDGDPTYLLHWLVLSSLRPLLFLFTIMSDVLRGDIPGVASNMIHSGLTFLISIFCMHLIYALYRQIKCKEEYQSLDEKIMKEDCCNSYQAVV